jgi:hypothetical protein
MAVGVIIHGLKENYLYALFLYSFIFKESKKKKKNQFFVTIAAIFHKQTRVSNHKSESGSYMHHFHKVWWQLAFYRILKCFLTIIFYFL